jgi:hypothetical protein
MEFDREYEPPVVEDLETEAEGATVVTQAGVPAGSPAPIGLAAPLEGEDQPPKPSE